jgi:hypothetical protein
MTFQVGNKHGKGRPKGARNKRSRLIDAQARAIETQLSNGELTPLEFMLQVMRNPGIETNIRLAAANGAAPYCHPRAPAAHRILKHPFDTGTIKTAADAADRIVEIHAKVGRGELEVEEGKILISNIEAFTRVLAATQLEEMVDKVRSEIRAELAPPGSFQSAWPAN